ncbi:Ig-like domain-containing protein, partial [Paenibacillus planticolens]|uniref:Ig-like domain-containing protein n=1 Tax=Paenibacillus planticolens TaxID=2654976 RepID=UPI001C101EB5
MDASVNWDLSGISYDPAIKTVQTFSVPGTVTLPLGVENPNSVPLTTSINVTVKEVGAASDYLTLDKFQYIQGEAITLSYNGAALNGKDWVGIYKTGAVPPGAGVSLLWSYLKSGSGRVSLNSGLAPGTYDALFMLNDGYTIVDRKTFQVVQRVPLSGVTLDQQNVTMTQGETRTLTAAVLPANANDTRVSWISSDPTVVSIISTGSSASLIGNRPGTATVTVKTLDGNFTASANVTV